MMTENLKPKVSKDALLSLAGGLWLAVGIMLLSLAFSWLNNTEGTIPFLFAGLGIILALIGRRLAFQRMVDKNVTRIQTMKDKQWVLLFMPWKSYLIIPFMVAMGATLRHSAFPKPHLAIIYIGVGLALALSSLKYFTVQRVATNADLSIK